MSRSRSICRTSLLLVVILGSLSLIRQPLASPSPPLDPNRDDPYPGDELEKLVAYTHRNGILFFHGKKGSDWIQRLIRYGALAKGNYGLFTHGTSDSNELFGLGPYAGYLIFEDEIDRAAADHEILHMEHFLLGENPPADRLRRLVNSDRAQEYVARGDAAPIPEQFPPYLPATSLQRELYVHDRITANTERWLSYPRRARIAQVSYIWARRYLWSQFLHELSQKTPSDAFQDLIAPFGAVRRELAMAHGDLARNLGRIGVIRQSPGYLGQYFDRKLYPLTGELRQTLWLLRMVRKRGP